MSFVVSDMVVQFVADLALVLPHTRVVEKMIDQMLFVEKLFVAYVAVELWRGVCDEMLF